MESKESRTGNGSQVWKNLSTAAPSAGKTESISTSAGTLTCSVSAHSMAEQGSAKVVIKLPLNSLHSYPPHVLSVSRTHALCRLSMSRAMSMLTADTSLKPSTLEKATVTCKPVHGPFVMSVRQFNKTEAKTVKHCLGFGGFT